MNPACLNGMIQYSSDLMKIWIMPPIKPDENGGIETHEIIQNDSHSARIVADSDGHGTDVECCTGKNFSG
jgi:hypothetical protein